MNCEEFKNCMNDYIDGLADETLHARMDAHMAGCEACEKLLSETRAVADALKGLGDSLPVPDDARDAWRRAVKREAAKLRARRVWRTVAACAAAICVWVGATAVMDNAGLLNFTQTPVRETVMYTGVSQKSKSRSAVLQSDGIEALSASSDSDSRAPGETMLVVTARRDITSSSLDEDIANLDDLVGQFDGYYEFESENEAGDGRVVKRTIRVPSENAESFLSELAGIGETTYSELRSEDVTLNYYDAQKRLETLSVERDKYDSLIAEAADSNEVERLSALAEEAQKELDQINSNIRKWATSASYASIEVTLASEGALIAPEGSVTGDMRSAWRASLGFLRNMMLSLAFMAPALIVVAVSLVVIFAVRHYHKRKNREGETA